MKSVIMNLMIELDFRLPFVNYTFTQHYKAKFGKALYLSGSLPELGNWTSSRAIRMTCKNDQFWAATVAIPIQLSIEYKFFVASYDLQSNLYQNQEEVLWLGDFNRCLRVPYSLRDRFEKKEEKNLKVMSFNLRYENDQDKGDKSWDMRKSKCCSLILESLPDLLGIQEGKSSQINYLQTQIGQFYRYFGRPRDLLEDEHCGIYVRRDRFFVLEDDYIWINETQTPGHSGFGSTIPRYFTYVILKPVNGSENWVMAVNTHLDHVSQMSREEGIKLIAGTIHHKMAQYCPQLKDIFITGDFNTSDTDPIFEFSIGKEALESVRCLLPKKDSDMDETFHGFSPKLSSMLGMVTSRGVIDHIFVKLKSYKPVRFMRLRQPVVSDHYPIMGEFVIREG